MKGCGSEAAVMDITGYGIGSRVGVMEIADSQGDVGAMKIVGSRSGFE